MTAPVTVTVRPAEPTDDAAWRALYRGYGDFYKTPLSDAHLDGVWRQITVDGTLECFLAEVDGTPVGLAHVSEILRPLDGGRGGYLHDLYVDASRRGTGAGRALIEHLRHVTTERGWITAADNTTAQRLYDQYAERTTWVTYDLRP